MKTVLLCATIIATSILISSCSKEVEEFPKGNTIIGSWVWVKSQGGFGGWTLSPETEKKTVTIEFDGQKLKEIVDGTVSKELAYTIEMKPDSVFAGDMLINLEDGHSQNYEIKEDRLFLYDLCFDCYIHEYKRK